MGWALCGSGVNRLGGVGGWWRALRDPGRNVRALLATGPVRLGDVQRGGESISFSQVRLVHRAPHPAAARGRGAPSKCH